MASEGREINRPWRDVVFDWVAEKILPIILMGLLAVCAIGFVVMLVTTFVAANKPIPALAGHVIQRYEFDHLVVREIEIDGQHYMLASDGSNYPRSVSICPVPAKPAEENIP